MAWYSGIATYFADILMGMVCLVWFLIMIKFPWDAYYRAKEVIDQMERSKKDNLVIDKEEEDFVRTARRRILVVCLLLHTLSAVLVFGVAWYFRLVVGFAFGIFYMVSSAFRPLHKSYQYLHNRFLEIQKAVRHPRDNLVGYEEKTKKRLELIMAKFEARLGDRKVSDIPKYERDKYNFSYDYIELYDIGGLRDEDSLKAKLTKFRNDFKKEKKEIEYQQELVKNDLAKKVETLADSLEAVAERILEKPESLSEVKKLVSELKSK